MGSIFKYNKKYNVLYKIGMQNMIYILEIILSILGTYIIFIQNPKTIQNSFVANSLETFSFKKIKGNYKFWLTVIITILLAAVILIDVKIH